MRTAGLRATLMALIAGVAATLVFAASASAATKPYSLVVQPAAVPPGTGAVSMTAKFTNENKVGTGINVGSANLTPPTGFTVTSASIAGCQGCANVVSNVVQLRGLALAPGSSVALSMHVTTPAQATAEPFKCTVNSDARGSTCTWSVLAKQSNDFSGPPGNNLTVDALPNTVLGQLTFSAQPASEMLQDPLNSSCGNLIGCPDPITDTGYTPSGGPVKVSVVDYTGTVVTAYTGAVSLALNAPAFPPNTNAQLSGTTLESASNGVASFSDLVVSLPGNGYTLAAVTQDSPPLNARSSTFDVQQNGSQCATNKSCRTEVKSAGMASPGGIDATVTATFGQTTDLAESVDFGSPLPVGTLSPPTGCEGYNALHDVFWGFASPTGSTTLSITTTTAGNVTGSMIKGQDSCLGAPKTFLEIDESTNPPSLRQTTSTTLDGATVYVGLLPDCGTRSNQVPRTGPGSGPCVISRSGAGNTLTITTSVPASFGDFQNRG